jgi:hypothetical protein
LRRPTLRSTPGTPQRSVRRWKKRAANLVRSVLPDGDAAAQRPYLSLAWLMLFFENATISPATMAGRSVLRGKLK